MKKSCSDYKDKWTNMMKLCSNYKDNFVERHGVKLGLMSCFVKIATTSVNSFVHCVSALLSSPFFFYLVCVLVSFPRVLF
nr:hypothetical protein SEVIR_4G167800v2 [Setaria viridis]